MSHIPEDDLAHELQKQERELHSNLLIINEIFDLCCDESLSKKELLKKTKPCIDKLSKTNPLVAKEIWEVLESGDREQIFAYFEEEKSTLTDTLANEMKKHQGINAQINREKEWKHPTDS